MKTAAFILSLSILFWLCPGSASGSWNLSLDGDVRAEFPEGEETTAWFNVAGLSLRKTISDQTGDRLILFALMESRDDFSDTMLHELYARYKGPMGKWNITVGRFQLPFGLLTGFTTSRLLYDSLFVTTDPDADSGLMISGVAGNVDYGIAMVQGIGVHGDHEFPGPGNAMGRLGMTFGNSEEVSAGISAMIGRSRHPHHEDHIVPRQVAAMDATAVLGRWITRWEVQAGKVNDSSFRAGFAMADFSVLSRLNLTAAGKIARWGYDRSSMGYLGLGYQLPWFTVRGGYTYEDSGDHHAHVVSIQLYRLLSFPF